MRTEMRDARKRERLSYEALAQKIGVTASSIRHIEFKRQTPNAKHMLMISKILRTPPDVLFGDLLEPFD